MQKFNITVAKKYIDSQGVEKTKWVKIGSVVDLGVGQDGKRKMFGDLETTPTFDWDGSFNLFEQEQNDKGGGNQQTQSYQQPQQGQQQSYQQSSTQEYKNAQGQLTDANGQLLLDQNGQPRYN